jgi:site-specific DNA recombinase
MANKRRKATSSQIIRVAIYARYSTEYQHSIEQQVRVCREYAAEQGWIVVEECIFYDEAKSGQTVAGRDAFERLMTLAQQDDPPVDGILAADTSRFGRNMTETLHMSEVLEYLEIFLYFVENDLDSRDRNFRRLFIDSSHRDEEFVRQIARKVHDAQRERALAGYLPCGRVYGYDNVPIPDLTRRGKYGRPAVKYVELVINPVQAAIVRQIFKMYSRGLGCRVIAATLNEQGASLPLQSTNTPVRRVWNTDLVRRILQNEKYHGVNVWCKTRIVRNPTTKRKEQKRRPESDWERVKVPKWQIVSDELWEAVRAEHSRRLPRWRMEGSLNQTRSSRSYLFSDLMDCSICDGKINVVSGKGEDARYGCREHKKGNCKNRFTVPRRVLEERLLGALARNLQSATLRAELVREFHEKGGKAWEERAREAAKATASVPQLRQRHRELECQARNLAQSIAASGESKILRETLDSVEAEQKTVEQLLAVADQPEEKPLPVEVIEEFLERKMNDLISVFQSDPERTKLELRKRVTRLVLEPRHTSEGPMYEVTGDIRVLAGDEDGLHGRSGTRTPNRYHTAAIPFSATIPAVGTRARPLAVARRERQILEEVERSLAA